jgi:cation transport protein ChaC
VLKRYPCAHRDASTHQRAAALDAHGLTLAGYRRVFNKKSVENWGTKEWPGLTLNLKASTTSVCRGVAFAFADDDSKSQNMLNFLTKREACQPQSLAIQLLDGRDVRCVC